MKKAFAIGFCLVLVTAGASASLVPQNMTLDVNLNLEGVFGGGEEQQQEEEPENNTYGERVGGQSVHTEERSNDPAEQRNTEEMKVTNDQVASGEDPIIAFLSGIFG
jgi:hypothetical protein